MGNYYIKSKYINDDSISTPMNKYLNKYCESHQNATGTSGVVYEQVFEERKKVLLDMEIGQLSDNIKKQIFDESWGRLSDMRDIGGTYPGMGSLEILKIWNDVGMYKKLNELNENKIYDLKNITRYGDNILIGIVGEPAMKAVIITNKLKNE